MQRQITFDYRHFWDQVMVPNYATPAVTLARGLGCEVWDTEGKRYLDFIGGLAVLSLGHAHPRLTQAIAKQAALLGHVSNLYGNLPALRLAGRLTALSGLDRALFLNSGAEANEAAIKLARKWGTGRGVIGGEIVAAENGFHGRTLGALAATGQPKYHRNFEPLPPGFRHVPYNDLHALEAALTPRTVAVMLEPIQGEGGVVPADVEYLKAVRELCTEKNVLLILDEVQTGVGRTGAMFAFEKYGVKPDILTLAKGLGGGFPIAALLAREPVARAFAPGDHGCTFGGNPLAAAAALAVLDALEEESLLANAAERGRELARAIHQKCAKHVDEVRGEGLLLGVVLKSPVARKAKEEAEKRGLLVNAVGDQVIRLAPPLVLSAAQVEEGVSILKDVLGAAKP